MKAIFFETLEWASLDDCSYRQKHVLFPEKEGMCVIINWPNYWIYTGAKIENFQQHKDPNIKEDVQFFLIKEIDVSDEIVEEIYYLSSRREKLSNLVADLKHKFDE